MKMSMILYRTLVIILLLLHFTHTTVLCVSTYIINSTIGTNYINGFQKFLGRLENPLPADRPVSGRFLLF